MKTYNSLSYETVKEYIEAEGYTLLEKSYENNHTKMHMNCPNGHDCYIRFDKFKQRGQRCSTCSGNKKLTLKEVSEYVTSLSHTLLDDTYTNARTPLHLMCSKGHTFERAWYVLQRTPHCPVCKGSNGERLVEAILRNLIPDIDFKPYHTVSISDNAYVIFDFYIPVDGLHLFIEFDGKQHFEPVEKFGGQCEFNKTVERDKSKDAYVKRKTNHEMLRVSWYQTDEEIFNSIKSFLRKYTTVTRTSFKDLDRTLIYKPEVNAMAIAEYYLTHTKEQTAAQFGIYKEETYKIFERVMGCSKREYKILGK